MNEENDRHELNFFLDKQIQQKLLEADDQFLEKEYTFPNAPISYSSSKVKTNFVNIPNGSNSVHNSNGIIGKNNNNTSVSAQTNSKCLKYLHSIHVDLCGWCPNPNVIYRKAFAEAPPRSRGNFAVIRESLFSRDSKSRPQNLHNYVFRHYSDPRKYIEQYRREHSCYDTAIKSELLDSRRFYAYNQYSPLAVGSQQSNFVPQQQTENIAQNSEPQQKSHQQTLTLQYTNRREQQRQTISASLQTKNHQYKLTKTLLQRAEHSYADDYTEEYSESLEIINKQKLPSSAKERPTAAVNGLSLQKSNATKGNVPVAPSGSKNGWQPVSGGNPDSGSLANISGQRPELGTGGASRTLDALACVAGTPVDKQGPGLPAAIDGLPQADFLESAFRVSHRPIQPRPDPLPLIFIQEENQQPEAHSGPPRLPGTLAASSRTTRNYAGNGDTDLHLAALDNLGVQSDNIDVQNGRSRVKFEELTEMSSGSVRQKKRKKLASIHHENVDVDSCKALMLSHCKGSQQSNAVGRHWQSKSWMSTRKVDDPCSLSHQRRIKHIIEQSRLTNKCRPGLRLQADAMRELTDEDRFIDQALHQVAVGVKCFTAVSEQHEDRASKWKHSSADRKENGMPRRHLEIPPKPFCSEPKRTSNQTESGSGPVVKGVFCSLQTQSPSIPLLCGTGLGNATVEKPARIWYPCQQNRLTPFSHPDLEKLAEQVAVRFRVSGLTCTKTGHLIRSQTIHL